MDKPIDDSILTPEEEKRYKVALKHFQKEVEPLVQAIRNSTKITAADLAITINARA